MRGKSLTCRTFFIDLSVYDRLQMIFSISTFSGLGCLPNRLRPGAFQNFNGRPFLSVSKHLP